jgi:uncharacterized membrane protein
MSLPPAVYELLAAPGAFALAAVHAWRALGPRRAAVELFALVAYGYGLERTAIVAFGSHDYGHAWRSAMGGVPVAVAVTWSAVIVAAMSLASRLARSSVGRAAAAALIGISLDLLMEPVAVRAGLWSWTPPGPWLDVPAGNFIGWAVIMGAYTFGAERWGASGPLAAQAVRRLALGGAAVGVLLGVGTVWHALGAERLFSGPRGWAACGLLWAATAAMALRPRPSRVNAPRESAGEPPERGLAARLGAAGGPLPASVLLLLTAVFATDAVAQGDARLALVALGSAGVLAAVAARAAT